MVRYIKLENWIFDVPTSYTDLKLVASDGYHAVHSLLLSLHSPLIKSTFKTLVDPRDSVIVMPDYKLAEVEKVSKVMCGFGEFECVTGSLLDTLGLNDFKSNPLFKN